MARSYSIAQLQLLLAQSVREQAAAKAAEMEVLYAATAQGFFGKDGLSIMRELKSELRRMMDLNEDGENDG